MAIPHIQEGTDSTVDNVLGVNILIDQPLPSPGTSSLSSSPPPAKVFYTYRRGPFGRKHIFSETTGPTRYWIFNPVPQKHANSWRPILWRGDNPKYCPESVRIGRARRTGFWNSFKIHLGDGIQEVILNDQRRFRKKWYERGQKFRRAFRMKPTPPKKPLEDEKEVEGFIMSMKMWRPKGLGRSLKWTIGEQEYMWKGTRKFLPDKIGKWKGVSHDFKLINSDNAIIATFEKERWASFKPAEKPGLPPNKRRTCLGKLTVFPAAYAGATTLGRVVTKEDVLVAYLSKASDTDAQPGKTKHDKLLNLEGTHSGDLLEEAIVFTCWMAIESEHRMRWKILDLLEEIGEAVGG